MYDRIRKIRKDAGLTQAAFAESLGLSRIMITQVENQRECFSDRSIRDLCRIYNVNEEWLRSGVGVPYKERPINHQIADFINSAMGDVDDSIKKRLILALSRLSEDEWELLDKIARDMVNGKEEA